MFVKRLNISRPYGQSGNTAHSILRWLQSHPEECKQTSVSELARKMSGFSTPGSREQVLNKLRNQGLVTRYGTPRKADYSINYMSHLISSDLLELAPEDQKAKRKEFYKSLEKKHNIKDNLEKEVKQEVVTITKAEPKEPVKVTEPEVLTAPIEVKKDGNGIQLTITLNINL